MSSTAASPVSDKECCDERQAKILELKMLDLYEKAIPSVDFSAMNPTKTERDCDWFFSRMEELLMCVDCNDAYAKIKLVQRRLRGRMLQVWVKNSANVTAANMTTTSKNSDEEKEDCYERVRDACFQDLFPNSTYYEQLKDLYSKSEPDTASTASGGGDNSPSRRKLNLANLKSVLTSAKETMRRAASRYNKEMPNEAFWIEFAERIMNPTVKENYSAAKEEFTPEMTVEDMLNATKDPRATKALRPSIMRRANRRNTRRTKKPTVQGVPSNGQTSSNGLLITEAPPSGGNAPIKESGSGAADSAPTTAANTPAVPEALAAQ